MSGVNLTHTYGLYKSLFTTDTVVHITDRVPNAPSAEKASAAAQKPTPQCTPYQKRSNFLTYTTLQP